MQRYAFFPNCNKNMQNINHFLIFSNTYNPKHTPPPPKKKNPPTTNPLKKNPSAPSCSELLRVLPKSPTKKILHPKKAKKDCHPPSGQQSSYQTIIVFKSENLGLFLELEVLNQCTHLAILNHSKHISLLQLTHIFEIFFLASLTSVHKFHYSRDFCLVEF